MDRLTFVAKIIEALRWPVVALIFLWWLRPHYGGLAKRFGELLDRVQRVTFPGGGSVNFRPSLPSIVREPAIHLGALGPDTPEAVPQALP